MAARMLELGTDKFIYGALFIRRTGQIRDAAAVAPAHVGARRRESTSNGCSPWRSASPATSAFRTGSRPPKPRLSPHLEVDEKRQVVKENALVAGGGDADSGSCFLEPAYGTGCLDDPADLGFRRASNGRARFSTRRDAADKCQAISRRRRSRISVALLIRTRLLEVDIPARPQSRTSNRPGHRELTGHTSRSGSRQVATVPDGGGAFTGTWICREIGLAGHLDGRVEIIEIELIPDEVLDVGGFHVPGDDLLVENALRACYAFQLDPVGREVEAGSGLLNPGVVPQPVDPNRLDHAAGSQADRCAAPKSRFPRCSRLRVPGSVVRLLEPGILDLRETVGFQPRRQGVITLAAEARHPLERPPARDIDLLEAERSPGLPARSGR